MTVHGAKGLEAPVVFLIDTMTGVRGAQKSDALQWAEGETPVPLWAPRAGDRAQPLSALMHTARDKERAEHNRLLYVAMTRAKDALIVMGAQPGKSADEDCWHAAVTRAMERSNAPRQGR